MGGNLLKPSLYQAGGPCLVSGLLRCDGWRQAGADGASGLGTRPGTGYGAGADAGIGMDAAADANFAAGTEIREQLRAAAEAVEAAGRRAAEIVAGAESRAATIAADAARQAEERALGELQDEIARTRERAAAEAGEIVAAARAQSQMALAAVEREAIVLALEIARKVVASELQVSPEVVLAVAGEALGRLPNGVAVAALRVSPEDLQRALAGRERLKNISGDLRELEVISHPQVARGGCIVETPAGDVDARIETRFGKLEQALLPDAEDGEGGA
ncbi:MAG: FliH/SctL family protein [Bacillota bacterium]|nr:FliH/SctL family protein [Bacillota bacterium]